MEGGLFSPLMSNGIGDPYVDKFRVDVGHGATKGVRQFAVGKGLPGQFQRLYEGEPYIDQAKIDAMNQLTNKKKMITSNGFRYSSPPKKAFPGDYNGTFTRPYPHIPDGSGGSRDKREPVRSFSPRNIYTSPPKRSTYGLTPHICFTEISYIPSDYDNKIKQEQTLNKTMKAKTVGPAFIVRKSDHPIEKSQLKPDTTPLVFSPIGSRPTSAKSNGVFRPTSPTHRKGPVAGAFSTPDYVSDPYDEKKIKAAVNPSRVLPETLTDGNNTSRGKNVWRPNSPAKEMFTKSIAYFKK